MSLCFYKTEMYSLFFMKILPIVDFECIYSSADRALTTHWIGKAERTLGVGPDAVQEKKPYAAWNQTQAVHPVARLYID
jgi:hypothetical protein